MALNIIDADISTTVCATSPLYQWDYGQTLMPTGAELPETYEVHFAVPNDTTTMTVLGNADGVAIPDELLQSAGQIVAYIYLHSGTEDGETEYKIIIPVMARPKPSDYEPAPIEQDVITQAIAALDTAVDNLQRAVPTGGETGQVLAKASDADYDTVWINQQGGGGSSDYNDLTNKPSINGVTLEGDVTISVPSKTSELVNDSGYITAIPSEYVTDSEMASALLPKANSADLATVATSGSYNDLSNKPTIPTVPTNVSAFTNDAGYLTSAVTSFNGSTGAVTYTAPVSSVNGQTGAVVIANATTSADGLLSATDKGRLDALYDDYSSALTALGV